MDRLGEDFMPHITFSRRPYEVTYYKDGERHTIRRRPPPKLHNIWPEDVVSIVASKNEDWQEGDEHVVRNINHRNPNVIQLDNEDGGTTFMNYFDLELEEAIGPRDGRDPEDSEDLNRYLTWP